MARNGGSSQPPKNGRSSTSRRQRRTLLRELLKKRKYGSPDSKLPHPDAAEDLTGSSATIGISRKAGFYRMRGGRAIYGWASGTNQSLPKYIVRIDNQDADQVEAIDFDRDLFRSATNQDRVEFVFHSPLELADGSPHQIALVDPDTNQVIASKEVFSEQDKGYKDFDSLLRWLYWRRVCFAPFSYFDKRCISYMEWRREFFASRRKAANPAQPLVSIVMVEASGESNLERSVRSVLRQSYKNWELIFVDEGSDVAVSGAAPTFGDPRIRHHRSGHEQPSNESSNLETLETEGDFLAYLDGDCWWHSQYLELMIGALTDNPQYQAVFCGQYLFEEDGADPFAFQAGPFNPSLMENRNYIDLSAFVHRAGVVEANGLSEESIARGGAWDLIQRCTEDESPYFLPCVLSNKKTDRWNVWRASRLARPNVRFENAPRVEQGAIYPSSPLYLHSPQRTNISVVVPSYNVPDILTTCIEHLVATVDLHRTEIIICDNGSDASTHRAITALREKYPRIVVEFLDRNYGFSYAANRGIERANPANDVVLLNNDTIPTPGWLAALEAVLIDFPDVGIVAPQQVLFPGTPTVLDHVPFADLDREVDVNVSPLFDNLYSWDAFGTKKIVELNFAPFFCVLISREVIDRIGLLDEERGRHYQSDRIYCNAARHIANKRIAYTWYSKVYHLLQESTKDLRERDVEGFRAMFERNDWSDFQDPETP